MTKKMTEKETYFNMVDRKRQLDRMIMELNAEYQEIIWEGTTDQIAKNESLCDDLNTERTKLLYQMEKMRDRFNKSTLKAWKAEYNAR